MTVHREMRDARARGGDAFVAEVYSRSFQGVLVDEFATTPDGTIRPLRSPDAGAVRAQMNRILRTPLFSQAPSVSRLLVHVVEQTLDGHADQIKEYSLGVDVFLRGAAFDPRIDTIVRVQARRLRSKLQQYYRTDGRDDPVVIGLVKGRYVPEFAWRDPAATVPPVQRTPVTVEAPGPAVAPARPAESSHRRARPIVHAGVATGLLVIVVTAAAVGLREFPASEPSVTAPAEYVPLTDFADSATAPALSADGRMLAFLRGGEWFLSRGQIYVKTLPNGEPVQLTRGTNIKLGPVFTPDGSHIAYTRADGGTWDTWIVSVNGGEPTRLLPNAAGLVWLDSDRVMFSEVRPPAPHMGIVTASQTRGEPRDIYFPLHERGMAHFSYPSPDHRSVLVVEMDGTGTFQPCRVVPFAGGSPGRRAGPPGKCTAAAWSPDGAWMYFSVETAGQSHLWRQSFPTGIPERITFGPTEEEGVAVAPDGRSLITSLGRRRSAIWIHDAAGERPLSTEGYAFAPKVGAGGRRAYYLFRQNTASPLAELRAIDLQSGVVERILPGMPVAVNDIGGFNYDISRDEQEVVFATKDAAGHPAVWLARVDRALPPRRIAQNADLVSFGANGDLFFVSQQERTSVLMRMTRDGTLEEQVGTISPIINRSGVSPDGEWVVVFGSRKDASNPPETVAVPVHGGDSRRICTELCWVWWSEGGRLLHISFSGAEQTIVVPLRRGRVLPDLPASGLSAPDEGLGLEGARLVQGLAVPVPGSPGYVFVKTELRRNLYRIPLRH